MLMKDFTTVYLLGIAHTQVIISRSACFAKSCQIPPWHVTVGHILYTSKVLTKTKWSLRTNREIHCFYFRANLNDYRLIVITDSIPLRLTVYFTSVWCWVITVITAYPVRMFDKASHWIFVAPRASELQHRNLRSSRPASVAWCLQEHLDDFFDDRCRICMNVHLWWMFTCFSWCWLVQLRRRSQEEHELFGPVIIFNF